MSSRETRFSIVVCVTCLVGWSGLYTPPASAQDCPELVGRWPYGRPDAVGVFDEHAYFGSGMVLTVADVSDPARPQIVGEVVLPDSVSGVVVSGGFAYVANDEAGLRVIDISTPSLPAEVGFLETAGYARGIALYEGLAFVADGFEGLQVIDISTPSSPSKIGFFDTPGFAFGVTVSDGLAYIAEGGEGLRVIDISSPSSPSEVGFFETPGYAYGVAVSNGLAYVADGSEGLRVIDISTPSSPSEVGFFDTSGTALSVAVINDLVYVADANDGLRVIDVSSPSSPAEIGFFEPTGYARSLTISDGFAYVADRSAGLRVIDISSPSSPTEVGFLDTPNWAYDLAVSEGFAYVADRSAGLRVIDISSPSSPIEVGFLDTPGYAIGITLSEGFAYVADGDQGLRVIDISSPSLPIEAGFFDTPGYANNVAVSDGFAFVADGLEGLRVIDISSPNAPAEVGSFDTPGYAYDVAVSDGFAFVADGSEGLRVISISSPSTPAEIGFFDTPNRASSVALSEGYAFIADYYSGLRVIDVNTPSSPSEVGFFDTLGYADAVAHSEGFAYVADTYWGLRVIDVRTPDSPAEVGFIDTPGTATGVTVSSDYVYIADGSTGVAVFRACPPDQVFSDCTPIYIAAAATGAGAGRSSWDTDLGINNTSDEVLTYKFKTMPRGEDNTDAAFTGGFAVQPNTTVNIVDIWVFLTLASPGAGSINVCVSDPDAAGVVSRTYNTSQEGTFGQTIVGVEGLTSDTMIATGEVARLGFLTENAAFRTNVGFMNAGAATITINAQFFTADGTSLGTDSIEILSYSNDQWNGAFGKVTAKDVDLGYIDVWTNSPNAEFLTYASVIDNQTDDPTTIWPFDTSQMVGGGSVECTPVWIAAAASTDGAGATFWATDLGLNNLDSNSLTYQFQFLPRGENNTDVSFSDSFSLGGNQAIAYSDVWQSVSGSQGAGAINVCVDNADAAGVVSRTYNTGDGGTFGQTIIGMRGSSPTKVATGEKARLGYLFENDTYRTNIGFMNTGANEITIKAEFFDMQGISFGIKRVTLAPFSSTQWNRAYTLDPISTSNVTAGFVDVWTITPDAAFLTYASIVDNGTGDPTTIWPF